MRWGIIWPNSRAAQLRSTAICGIILLVCLLGAGADGPGLFPLSGGATSCNLCMRFTTTSAAYARITRAQCDVLAAGVTATLSPYLSAAGLGNLPALLCGVYNVSAADPGVTVCTLASEDDAFQALGVYDSGKLTKSALAGVPSWFDDAGATRTFNLEVACMDGTEGSATTRTLAPGGDGARLDGMAPPDDTTVQGQCDLCIRFTTTARLGPNVTQPQCDAFAAAASGALMPVLTAAAGGLPPFTCAGFNGSRAAEVTACTSAFAEQAVAAVGAFNTAVTISSLSGLAQQLKDGGVTRTFNFAYACPGGTTGAATAKQTMVLRPPSSFLPPPPGGGGGGPDAPCNLCMRATTSSRQGPDITRAQCDAFAAGVTVPFAANMKDVKYTAPFVCTSFSGAASADVLVCTPVSSADGLLAVGLFNGTIDSKTGFTELDANGVFELFDPVFGDGGITRSLYFESKCPNGAPGAMVWRQMFYDRFPPLPGSSPAPAPVPAPAPGVQPAPSCKLCMRGVTTGRAAASGDITRPQCDAFASGITSRLVPLMDGITTPFTCSSLSIGEEAEVRTCTLATRPVAAAALSLYNSTSTLVQLLGGLLADALGGDGGISRTFYFEYLCPGGVSGSVMQSMVYGGLPTPSPASTPAPAPGPAPMPAEACSLCMLSSAKGRQVGPAGGAITKAQCDMFASGIANAFVPLIQGSNLRPGPFACTGFAGTDGAQVNACTSSAMAPAVLAVKVYNASDISGQTLGNWFSDSLGGNPGRQATFTLQYTCPSGLTGSAAKTVIYDSLTAPAPAPAPGPGPASTACSLCMHAVAAGRGGGFGALGITRAQCDAFAAGILAALPTVLADNPSTPADDFSCNAFSGADNPEVHVCQVTQRSDALLALALYSASTDVKALSALMARALGGDAGSSRTFTLEYGCPNGATGSAVKTVAGGSLSGPVPAPSPTGGGGGGSPACRLCMRGQAGERFAGAGPVTAAQCDTFADLMTSVLVPALPGVTLTAGRFTCGGVDTGGGAPVVSACMPAFSYEAINAVNVYNNAYSDVASLGAVLGAALGGSAGNVRTFTLDYSCPSGGTGSASKQATYNRSPPAGVPAPTPAPMLPTPTPAPASVAGTGCGLCLRATASGRADTAADVTQAQCAAFAAGATGSLVPAFSGIKFPTAGFTCRGFSGSSVAEMRACVRLGPKLSAAAVDQFRSSADPRFAPEALGALLGSALGGSGGSVRTFTLDYKCSNGLMGTATKRYERQFTPSAAGGGGAAPAPASVPGGKPPPGCTLCARATSSGRPAGLGPVTQVQCDAFAAGVADSFTPSLKSAVLQTPWSCGGFGGTPSEPMVKACAKTYFKDSSYAVGTYNGSFSSPPEVAAAVTALSGSLDDALGEGGSGARSLFLEFTCLSGLKGSAVRTIGGVAGGDGAAALAASCGLCVRANATGRAAGSGPVTRAQCDAFAGAVTSAWAPKLPGFEAIQGPMKCSRFAGGATAQMDACGQVASADAAKVMTQLFRAGGANVAQLARLFTSALGNDGGGLRYFRLGWACPDGTKGSAVQSA